MMRHSPHPVLSVSFAIGFLTMASPAQLLFVSTGGNDANPGTTASRPLRQLSKALDIARTTPSIIEIRVTWGTFKPGSSTASTFALRSNLAVKGGYSPTFATRSSILRTTLSGEIGSSTTKADNCRTVVTAINAQGARLDRVSIRDGYGGRFGDGAGLHAQESRMVIVDCMFAGNHATKTGGAIYGVRGTAITVSSSTFLDNEAEGGGAIGAVLNDVAPAGIFVDRCRFLGNRAEYGGGIAFRGGRNVIASSAFSGNSAQATTTARGGAIYLSGLQRTTTVLNCTVTRNSAREAGGIYVASGSSRIWNTITHANTAFSPNRDLGRATGSAIDARYCCIGSPATFPGAGNISSDPNFLDARGPDSTPGTLDDNLRLPHPFLAASPCVNRGLDSFVAGAQFGLDLDRKSRRQAYVAGGTVRVDMGAYEVAPIAKLHPAIGDDLRLVVLRDNVVRNDSGTDATSYRQSDLLRFRVESPQNGLRGRSAWLALDTFVNGAPPRRYAIPGFRVGRSATFFFVGPVPSSFGGNGIPVPPGLGGAKLMAQAYVFDRRAPNGLAFATDGRELRFR